MQESTRSSGCLLIGILVILFVAFVAVTFIGLKKEADRVEGERLGVAKSAHDIVCEAVMGEATSFVQFSDYEIGREYPQMAPVILKALGDFRAQHPDLDVVGWQILYTQRSIMGEPLAMRVQGIFIDHVKKTNSR